MKADENSVSANENTITLEYCIQNMTMTLSIFRVTI